MGRAIYRTRMRRRIILARVDMADADDAADEIAADAAAAARQLLIIAADAHHYIPRRHFETFILLADFLTHSHDAYRLHFISIGPHG